MRFQKFSALAIWFFYFLILLLVALFVRDNAGEYPTFRFTLPDLIQSHGLGDPVSFATGALDVATRGWVSDERQWIFSYWPPGFVFLEAFIVKVFGIGTHFLFFLQIFAAALYSSVFTFLNQFFKRHLNQIFALFLPLILFVFAMPRVFLLDPSGLVLGESFAIGFFLLSIVQLFFAVREQNRKYFYQAAIFLTLSTYFRSQFEIFLWAMTLWVFVFKRSSFPIFLTLALAHLAGLPWRIYHYFQFGSAAWVQTSFITFQNSVLPDSYFIGKPLGFVQVGAGNLSCRIDPSTCGDIQHAKALFIRTFLHHPFEWYRLKAEVITSYWFSSPQNWVSVSVPPGPIDILSNSIFLLAIVGSFALLFTSRLRKRADWFLIAWLNVSIYFAYTFIFTVQHFEVRYFYFTKIFALFMFMIEAVLWFKPEEKTLTEPKV